MVNPTPSGHFLVAILARFPQRAFQSAKVQHFLLICKFFGKKLQINLKS